MKTDYRIIHRHSNPGLSFIPGKKVKGKILNKDFCSFKHFLIINCILLLCCVGFPSCTSHLKSDPLCYDINTLRSSKEFFSFKEPFTYIPLETNPGCLIGGVHKVILTSDFIFVQSGDLFYQFETNGKYIRKIGAKGRGPAEYAIITDVAVDEAMGQVYICDLKKINIYDFSGRYIGTKDLDGFSKRIEVINNMYVVYPLNYTGKEPCMLKIIEGNDSSTCLKNNVLYNSQDFFQVFDIKNFQKLGKELIFHQQFNDTVYRFDPGEKTLSVRYYFDFADAKFPLDLLENIDKYEDKSSAYGYLEDVCESGSYIFVTVFYKGEDEKYVINIKTGKSYAIDKNQDLIWPQWSDENGTMVRSLQVSNLKKHIDEIADARLRNLVSGLKDEDNPVIVLMK